MDLQKVDKLIVGKVMEDETPQFGNASGIVVKSLDLNVCPVCGSDDTEWSDTEVYTAEKWNGATHDVLYICASCVDCEAEWTIASSLSPLQTVIDVDTLMPFLEKNHPEQYKVEILAKEIQRLTEELAAKKSSLSKLLVNKSL